MGMRQFVRPRWAAGSAPIGMLAAASLLAASAEARTWEAPEAVSAANKAAISSTVGIDGDGDATLVWVAQDDTASSAQPPHRVRLATRAAGGAWLVDETPRSGFRARRPEIAVASDGTAVVVWLEQNEAGTEGKTWAMSRSGASPFGGPQMLSAASSDNALGAVFSTTLDAAGNGAIAWESVIGSTARPQVRLVAGGALAGSNATITGNPESFATTRRAPKVAVSSGGALVGFDRAVLGNPKPALVAQAGASFNAATELTPGTDSPAFPAIAVLPGGAVGAAWQSASKQTVLARIGTEETPQTISTSQASAPALAAAPDGTLVAAWRQDDEPGEPFSGVYVYAAVRPSGAASFSSAVQLSDEADTTSALELPVVGFAGNEAIVAWSRETGSTNRVEASSRPPGGSFQSIADQLSGPLAGEQGDAVDVALGTDPVGHAVVSWSQAFKDPLLGPPYFRIAAARSGYAGGKPPGDGGGGGDSTGGGSTPSSQSPDGGPPRGEKPVVSSFRVSRDRFAPGRKEGALSVGKGGETIMYPKGQLRSVLRVGTKFLFNSSAAGTATIKLVGTGCTKFLPTGKQFDEERSKKCAPAHDKTTIKGSASAGANRLPYLGKGLTPGGDYRATLTVTNTAGNVSASRSTELSLDGPR